MYNILGEITVGYRRCVGGLRVCNVDPGERE
jgi:hypothetical protein